MNTKLVAYISDDDNLLVCYEVIFRKRSLLLTFGDGVRIEHVGNDVYCGVIESLEDSINGTPRRRG